MKNLLYLCCFIVVACLSSCIEGNLNTGLPKNIVFGKDGGTKILRGKLEYEYTFWKNDRQLSETIEAPMKGDTVRFSYEWLDVAITGNHQIIMSAKKYTEDSKSRSISVTIRDNTFKHDYSIHKITQYNK